MNITITGRKMTVSQRLKDYGTSKIDKLEKYFNQLIDAHLILFEEKLDHVSEIIINGDGVQFHGREKSSTFYSSIDLLFEKMEKQIVKYKEKHSSHKVVPLGKIPTLDYAIEEGRNIILNQVSNKPIDSIEAFLQMKNDKTDFILFKKGVKEVESSIDYSNKNYAAIFKDNDSLKLVEIPFDSKKDHGHEFENFVVYDVNVIEDSLANPNIEFTKSSNCEIPKISLDEAFEKIDKGGIEYFPFFNIESNYLNIIYKNGKDHEVMVPAY